MSENRNRHLERILIFADWDWDEPEEVYDKWIRKDHEAVGQFLTEIYNDCDAEKIKSLYFNYEYLENQLLTFITADSQAYDKTRWVLKQYFERLIGGIPDEIPDDCDGCRKHYHPEFGTTDDWLDYIEIMNDMHRNGPTEKVMRGIKRMQILHQEYLNS